MAKILVIDDEDTIRRTVAASLEAAKYQIFKAADVKKGLKILDNETIDLVLSDLRLPDGSGIDLLRAAKAKEYPCEVIIMTGYATLDTAIQAMQEGASDYVTKPFNIGELSVRIERALQQKQLRRKVRRLERELHERFHPDNIISNSANMQKVLEQVKNIAPTDSSVLITGESGTGKELIANAIHLLSKRSEHPFIAVNCGALPESLLESELFGHVRGAFTGATNTRAGLIESSDGGTLLLDEIGDASIPVQTKLLRVLENGTIRRVGDTQERKINIRLLAATNKELTREITAGRFRQDFYYRINVIPIHLPPLRERLEDIPLLAKFFLKRHAARISKQIEEIDSAVIEKLMQYSWPGNIRELENLIEYAVAMADSEMIRIKNLPFTFSQESPVQNKSRADLLQQEILPIAEIEKRHILLVLEKVNWNQRKACDLLQISKVTLYRRLKEYGISPPGGNAPGGKKRSQALKGQNTKFK